MSTNKKIRNLFCLALEHALIKRYSKLPSASFLAREFNLRANSVDFISQESARKWLRGLSLPQLDKLIILRDWLDLDLNALGHNQEDLKKLFADKKLFKNKTAVLKRVLSSMITELNLLEQDEGNNIN